jgi:hypothetical protein
MSSEGRFLIPFFQTPEEFKGELPTRYRVGKPKKTWEGRVVYTRKRHFFTTKDIKRILKNILENDDGKKSSYQDFIVEFDEIQSMMYQLWAKQLGIVGINVYDELKSWLATNLPFLLSPPQPPK